MNYLVGCIDSMNAPGKIRTLFLLAEKQGGDYVVQNVTASLAETIENYNKSRGQSVDPLARYNGNIPMKLRGGFLEYPHGCGLSHYLSEETLHELDKHRNDDGVVFGGKKILMLTPADIRDLLQWQGPIADPIFRDVVQSFVSERDESQPPLFTKEEGWAVELALWMLCEYREQQRETNPGFDELYEQDLHFIKRAYEKVSGRAIPPKEQRDEARKIARENIQRRQEEAR